MAAIQAPPQQELNALLGTAQAAWQQLLVFINAHYEMQTLWNTAGKAGKYEYKFRRGGKTLCALYPRENAFGFMVVLGRAEQEALESNFAAFSPTTQELYTATTPYHDGRWLMLEVTDTHLQPDMERLLQIKRKPNRTAPATKNPNSNR